MLFLTIAAGLYRNFQRQNPCHAIGLIMNLLTLILCSLIVIGTFLLWEFVAWFTHKYVMHGFLWHWHKSHHTAHGHALERNDLFALVFSLPFIGLFYYASQVVYNPYLLAMATAFSATGCFTWSSTTSWCINASGGSRKKEANIFSESSMHTIFTTASIPRKAARRLDF